MTFFQKKQYPLRNPPLHLRAARGAGAPDARRVHQPLHAHRHRPHGAPWNPREHHHGAGNPRIRLRQQPAVDEVEQPLRHQVQAQLDGRQGLPRRRRQGRMLPLLPLGRGVVPGPRRIPRLAAPLRLAVRLLLRRLQELGAGSQGRGLRHGPRLRAAAHPHHRGEPALPARPARRRTALRLALRPETRPRRVVLVAEQRGGTGPTEGPSTRTTTA